MPVFAFSSRPEQGPGQTAGDKENASHQKSVPRCYKQNNDVGAAETTTPRRRTFRDSVVIGAGASRQLPKLDNSPPDEDSAPFLKVASAATTSQRSHSGGSSDSGFGGVATSPVSIADSGTGKVTDPAVATPGATAGARVISAPEAFSSALEADSTANGGTISEQAGQDRGVSGGGGGKKKPRWGFRMARAVFSPGASLTPKREAVGADPPSDNTRIPGQLKPTALEIFMERSRARAGTASPTGATVTDPHCLLSPAASRSVGGGHGSLGVGGHGSLGVGGHDSLGVGGHGSLGVRGHGSLGVGGHGGGLVPDDGNGDGNDEGDGVASCDEEPPLGLSDDRSVAPLSPPPMGVAAAEAAVGTGEPSCVDGVETEENSAPVEVDVIAAEVEVEVDVSGPRGGGVEASSSTPIAHGMAKDVFFECSSQVEEHAEGSSDSEQSDKKMPQPSDESRQKHQLSPTSEDSSVGLPHVEEHHEACMPPASPGAAPSPPPSVSEERGNELSPTPVPRRLSAGGLTPDRVAAAAIEAAVAASVAGDADAAAAAASTAVRVCVDSSPLRRLSPHPYTDSSSWLKSTGMLEEEEVEGTVEPGATAAETEPAADGSTMEGGAGATLSYNRPRIESCPQATGRGLTGAGRRRNRRQAAQPELGLAYGHEDDQPKFSQAEVNAKIRERLAEEQATFEKTVASMKSAHEAELQDAAARLQQSCSDGDRAKMAARDTEALEREIAMLSERYGEAAAEAKANGKALLEKEALLDAVTAQLMGLKTELATEREAHSAEKLSLRDEADHERRARSAAEGNLAQLEEAYNRLEDTEREKRMAGIRKMKEDMKALAQAQFSMANKKFNAVKNRLEAVEAEARQLREAAKTHTEMLEAAEVEAQELRDEVDSLKRELIERSSEASQREYVLREEVVAFRVRELMAAKMIIEKFLPFNHFSSGVMWEELSGVLTAGGLLFPPLPPRRIKHLIVELYLATKQAVVGNMQEEIKKALLPIIHYQVDLWACEVSGRKFLGTHVHYVDSSFNLQHALLGVKHYAPSSEVQDKEKASGILFTIFKATLREYGISIADLAGGTTDSGPDVKAMCVNFLLALHDVCWDWCDCHLATKAAEHAFGTSADPQKSKNPGARSIFTLITKTAARVNQSPSFKQKFEELQLDMLDEVRKITKHSNHRWLSMVRTLERIIRLWHVFRRLLAELGEKFLLEEDDNKNAVLQLFSILQPLSAITRDGQFGEVPMTAEMHMAFAVLKMEVLDPSKPLRVFDIPPAPGSPEAEMERGKTRKGEKPPLPSRLVQPDDLHPVTVATRKELTKALVQRFYGRVWDPDTADPSPFRDLAVMLTPPFNTGKYLDALRLTEEDEQFLPKEKEYLAPTTDGEVKDKLTGIWSDLQKRAVEAAREEKKRAAQEDVESIQPFKRTRLDGARSRSPASSMFGAFGRSADVGGEDESPSGHTEDDELVDAVKGEIVRYQSHFMTPGELDPKAVLPWWATTGKRRFPALAPVAQQVFGNQASAAQVERDFSGCGILLPPTRSRMDTYWVEMVMFVQANFEHIPGYGLIPMIAPKDIRSCLPARFTGANEDLVAAEAIFDLLSNTAAPTVHGMDLDEE